ncbi:hypothetical protein R5R35_004191 [Gryllus longicercus]|uniref:Uncharacterized protein n=1 Tax=Gryllus longicercus TaxID=2509291 RepID=A0AAN9VJP0_9ORTH
MTSWEKVILSWSPAAKEQRRYSEIKKLEVEIQTERDARLFYEEKIEEMKKEKDRMETKKDEQIKNLQKKLCESQVQFEERLCEKERVIEKQAETIDDLDKDLHNRKDEIIALLEKVAVRNEELREKRIMVCENESLRNEKAILETKLIETEELVKELNNKKQSLDEDLNQKQKAIDDLMKMQTEENDSIKK